MSPSKQTDRKSDIKKSKTVQYSIVNKCCFQQYEIMFLNSKLNKRTPIEMKFYTHLSNFVSKISPNFKLNRTCESPADLKIHQKLGFCWGFLERVKTEFFSNHDQNLQQLGVWSGPKSATHHQSIPKPNHLKGIKGFSPATQDQEKEKPRL
jgi:hypothetical protein